MGGPSAIGDLLAGGSPGADQAQSELQGLASQIRDVGQMTDAMAQQFPMAQGEIAQIQQLLKQIIVKAAQAMSMQTQSGSAVPTGATMGPM